MKYWGGGSSESKSEVAREEETRIFFGGTGGGFAPHELKRKNGGCGRRLENLKKKVMMGRKGGNRGEGFRLPKTGKTRGP